MARRRIEELSLITYGLKEILESFQIDDIAKFDATLSNWFETIMSRVKLPFTKGTLRLLLQAKYIGLGEGHRERLDNIEYRNKTVLLTNEIIDTLEFGSSNDLIFKIGDLYQLFMESNSKDKEKSVPNSRNYHVFLTSKVLKYVSNNLNQDIYDCEQKISNTIKLVNLLHNQDDNKGISLMILQWATIKIKEKEQPRQKYIFSILPYHNFQAQLKNVSKYYENYDLPSAFNVITKSLSA